MYFKNKGKYYLKMPGYRNRCGICGQIGHNRRTCPQRVDNPPPQPPVEDPPPQPPVEDPPPQPPVEDPPLRNDDEYFNDIILILEKQVRNLMINNTVSTINDEGRLFYKEAVGLEYKQIKLINMSYKPMCLYLVSQNFKIQPHLIQQLPSFVRFIEPRSVNLLDVFTGYVMFLAIEGQIIPSIYTILNSRKPRKSKWSSEYKKEEDEVCQKLLNVVLDSSVKKPRVLEQVMIFNTSNIVEDLIIDTEFSNDTYNGSYQFFPSTLTPKNEALISALKMNYLMKQMIRLGGLDNENIGCILDLHQDVKIPKHDDLDLEAAGVPNKLFTNVT